VDERRYAAAVEEDVAQARALGVTSTPTFLINHRAVVGAISVDDFRWLVDEALRQRR